MPFLIKCEVVGVNRVRESQIGYINKKYILVYLKYKNKKILVEKIVFR